MTIPPATADALAALVADRTYGAAELAREAARVAAGFFAGGPDPTAAREFVRALATAQPTMAPLLNLANRLALAWQGADARADVAADARADAGSGAGARADAAGTGAGATGPRAGSGGTGTEAGAHAAMEVARRYPDAAAAALRATVAEALRVVASEPLLATISHSSTVLALCAELAPRQVLVARSLPGGEGVATAAALRALGHAARVVEDDALPDEWRRAVFIAGVDALGHGWFANKVGTARLGAMAREMWLLATPDKRLPQGLEHWWRCGPLFERAPLGCAGVLGVGVGVEVEVGAEAGAGAGAGAAPAPEVAAWLANA